MAAQETVQAPSVAAEWKRGWPLVLTGALGYAVGTFHLNTLGSMVKPLGAEFGWSRAEVSGVLGFIGLSALFIGPLVGLLADRIGARRIALAGVVLYCGGLASIGLTNHSIWTWYLSWAVMSALWPGMSPALWTTGVVGYFRRSRGLALGTTLIGTGLAAMICPPFAVWTIQHVGWRAVYFILGAVGVVVMLPLTYFCFKDARQEPDAADAPPMTGLTLAEAMQTVRFWTMGVAMLIAGVTTVGVIVHMQPIFTDAGVSPPTAAKLVALIGPTVIVGRIAIGYLLDMSRGAIPAALVIVVPMVGLAILIGYDGSLLWGALASICIAVCYGAEIDICAFLASRYFGLKAYSAVSSAMVGMLTIGAGFGPALLGKAFDLTGSYHTVLLGLLAAMALAVILIFSLGKYPTDRSGEFIAGAKA